MKILNFGSFNLDYVYNVEHMVRPGETIDSTGLECFPGGKGLNQSIAIRRAVFCCLAVRIKRMIERFAKQCWRNFRQETCFCFRTKSMRSTS